MSDRACSYGYYNFETFYKFCIAYTADTADHYSYKTQQVGDVEGASEDIEPIDLGVEQNRLRTSDKPAPLVNIGNTCYLNAIIQIIFMHNETFNFGYWLSNNIDFSQFSISDSKYYLAFYKFWYLSTFKKISRAELNDFVSLLSDLASFFEIGTQKDAHEALLKLLEIFDTGISVFLPNHVSINDTYFQGIQRNVKTCTNCNNTSLSFDHFFNIKILPMNDLNLALANAFKDNSFESHCLNCNSLCKHIISCTVYDHPRVLLVLVDRYTMSASYARSRRDCRKIKVASTLDLHGQKYKLGGIIMHLGTSVDSGHYIACVQRQGDLYICNDSVVHKVKSIPQQSGDAYLLFFIKDNSA